MEENEVIETEEPVVNNQEEISNNDIQNTENKNEVNSIQNDTFVDDTEKNLNYDPELRTNLTKCMDDIIKTNIEGDDLEDFGIDIETYKNAFKNSLIDRINDIASNKLE